MHADYKNIGGNPDFYPSALDAPNLNNFSTAPDYKANRCKSATRDRFTNSTAKQIDEDLRSTAIDDAKTLARQYNSLSEAEDLVKSCRLKKAILKEKLYSAEIRLQDLMTKTYIQKPIYGARNNDPFTYSGRNLWTENKFFKKHPSVSVLPIEKQEEKLAQIKEERAIHNHNLNVTKHKLDRIRGQEAPTVWRRVGNLRETSRGSRFDFDYLQLARENRE